jgi:hypothetical protein
MNEKDTSDQSTLGEKPEKKPDETAGFYFSSHVKIHDPNTKKVLVQKRGDN